MRKIVLFVALLLGLLQCVRQPISHENVELRVVFSNVDAWGVQDIAVLVNDSIVGRTDEQGFFTVPRLYETDSLWVEDPDFTFSRSRLETSSEVFVYEFSAQKQRDSFDLAAIDFLTDLQLPNGLVPSIEGGTVISTYDQALAIIAYCLSGNLEAAEKTLDFFDARRTIELEQGLGGFYQFRSPAGEPTGNRWMGDNAWLLQAVRIYHASANTAMPFKYHALEGSLYWWLVALEDPYGDGLYGGYRANGDTIHKITEGNIDAFAVISDAAVRASILRHLEAEKWDPLDGNLMAWPTNPAYKYALDCNTWSYCAFPDFPESARSALNKYELTTTSTATGESITGYCFDEDQDALWFEGTAQVAVMHWAANDPVAATELLTELRKGWITNASGHRGLPYAANHGTAYGADELWASASTDPCVSSTAWYLMASHRFNPFFHSKIRNITQGPVFWL